MTKYGITLAQDTIEYYRLEMEAHDAAEAERLAEERLFNVGPFEDMEKFPRLVPDRCEGNGIETLELVPVEEEAA